MSDRRTRIYEFTCIYYRRHGFPPTIREIMAGCDVSSTSIISFHLRRLIRDGLLMLPEQCGLSRAWVPADFAEQLAKAAPPPEHMRSVPALVLIPDAMATAEYPYRTKSLAAGEWYLSGKRKRK